MRQIVRRQLDRDLVRDTQRDPLGLYPSRGIRNHDMRFVVFELAAILTAFLDVLDNCIGPDLGLFHYWLSAVSTLTMFAFGYRFFL